MQKSPTFVACLLLPMLLGSGLAARDLVVWLKHESSPISRGSALATLQPCADSFCTVEVAQRGSECSGSQADTSCQDVQAFWTAIAVRRSMLSRLGSAPNNRLLAGEQLARARNCFRCHGELGQGGVANLGAFKGYIPGYFGRDFDSLTDDGRREVVGEWIMTGRATAVTEAPFTGRLASYFLERQSISMPQFSSLPPCEIELLTDYVLALREFGPLDVAGIDDYLVASTRLADEPYDVARAGEANCAR